MSNSHKYLVTGTAGFIGFHLALRLLEEGRSVVGVDNFNSYYDPKLKRARNALLEEHSNFHGVDGDIADIETLEKVFDETKPTMVCNLAAQPGVRYSLINPFAYTKSNVTGFINILEMCRHKGIERLIYASSSSVYGGNTKLPFSEDDPVNTPVSLYAATKRANELMAHTYTHLYDMQAIGLRFFTVYGPWGRPDMAPWLFSSAILRGEPIKVFNQGDMQRDFTYVDDIVTAVIASLDSEKLPRYELINLGNNKPEELLDFISAIEESTGKKAEKKFLPMQPGDVKATFADITLAKKLLGFEPTTDINEGIQKFVDWFLAHPELTEAR